MKRAHYVRARVTRPAGNFVREGPVRATQRGVQAALSVFHTPAR
jgi:hypothetical protein